LFVTVARGHPPRQRFRVEIQREVLDRMF